MGIGVSSGSANTANMLPSSELASDIQVAHEVRLVALNTIPRRIQTYPYTFSMGITNMVWRC